MRLISNVRHTRFFSCTDTNSNQMMLYDLKHSYKWCVQQSQQEKLPVMPFDRNSSFGQRTAIKFETSIGFFILLFINVSHILYAYSYNTYPMHMIYRIYNIQFIQCITYNDIKKNVCTRVQIRALYVRKYIIEAQYI